MYYYPQSSREKRKQEDWLFDVRIDVISGLAAVSCGVSCNSFIWSKFAHSVHHAVVSSLIYWIYLYTSIDILVLPRTEVHRIAQGWWYYWLESLGHSRLYFPFYLSRAGAEETEILTVNTSNTNSHAGNINRSSFTAKFLLHWPPCGWLWLFLCWHHNFSNLKGCLLSLAERHCRHHTVVSRITSAVHHDSEV